MHKERYILRIVAQWCSKLMRITYKISLEAIFGYRENHAKALLELWRDQIAPVYRPFDDTQSARLSLLAYKQRIVQSSIWGLKFHNQTHYATIYGILVYESLSDLLGEITPLYDFTDPLLLTVPSHSSTTRKRGYEVPRLVATQACKQGLRYWVTHVPYLLIKVRKTKQQSRIAERSQRLTNPHGVFVVSEPGRVRGRNIVLLDDVHTTGATLEECTRVLLGAGARRVLRITLAY